MTRNRSQDEVGHGAPVFNAINASVGSASLASYTQDNSRLRIMHALCGQETDLASPRLVSPTQCDVAFSSTGGPSVISRCDRASDIEWIDYLLAHDALGPSGIMLERCNAARFPVRGRLLVLFAWN